MSIDIKILRDLRPPIFASLADGDLQALADRLASVANRPRELIFSRGDPSSSMLLVASGRIRMSLSTPDGREIAFRFAGPSETVGEIGALDGGERSADAVAVDAVRAFVLTRADLDRLLQDRPSIGRVLMTWLCQRLRETTDQLEGVALLDIEQRLARFLLALARDRKPERDGRVRVTLPASQAELGFLLGASRPKINVALGALEDAGYIERVEGAILVEVDRLSTRADGQSK